MKIPERYIPNGTGKIVMCEKRWKNETKKEEKENKNKIEVI